MIANSSSAGVAGSCELPVLWVLGKPCMSPAPRVENFMCSKNNAVHVESETVFADIVWCDGMQSKVHSRVHMLPVQKSGFSEAEWCNTGKQCQKQLGFVTFRYELCYSQSFWDCHIQWQHPVWGLQTTVLRSWGLNHRFVNTAKLWTNTDNH